jgi:Transcription initiation factor TFIID, subunit TAF6 (also component of histone acetyltransferase SAGA)
LTCLIGRQLGGAADLAESFALRDLAASLLSLIAKKYSQSSHMLKPRLVRSCLKSFLDPSKPFGAHYGAVIGLQAVGGAEVVRILMIPNLREYSKLLSDGLNDSARRPAAERVLNALLGVLASLRDGQVTLANGHPATVTDDMRTRLAEKVGDLIASRIAEVNEVQLAQMVLEA